MPDVLFPEKAVKQTHFFLLLLFQGICSDTFVFPLIELPCVGECGTIAVEVESVEESSSSIPECSAKEWEPSGCQKRKLLMSSFLFCSKDF